MCAGPDSDVPLPKSPQHDRCSAQRARRHAFCTPHSAAVLRRLLGRAGCLQGCDRVYSGSAARARHTCSRERTRLWYMHGDPRARLGTPIADMPRADHQSAGGASKVPPAAVDQPPRCNVLKSRSPTPPQTYARTVLSVNALMPAHAVRAARTRAHLRSNRNPRTYMRKRGCERRSRSLHEFGPPPLPRLRI